MDVILVPGLWLDASSWGSVIPALERAGHRAFPLTLPGVGAPAAIAEGIGIAEWVAAVVAEIDAAQHPVALVGHSGGGNVVWGAADARPDKVARVIFVDTVPPAPGMGISEFDAVDGVVPFPGWRAFDEPDVRDLDEPTRARIAAQAQSVPIRTTSDGIALKDPARYGIPVTVLAGTMDAAALHDLIQNWPASAAEYAAISDVEVVTLGSGHWPQFSKPTELADAMVEALRERSF